MKKPKLLVLDDYEGELTKAPAMRLIQDLADVKILNQPINNSHLADLAEANIVLTLRERTQINKSFLDKCPVLELILQTGGHAYHVDQDEVTKRGIVIALGRGAKKPMLSVPELTFGFMLGLIRRIFIVSNSMKKGGWNEEIGCSLAGKTLGILGYGRHGKPTARIAEAFNMKVMAWDRTGDGEKTDEYGVNRVSMDELLSGSDIVSVHLKLSDDSRGFFDLEKFKKMKSSALFINTSRGAIVKEKDLIEALKLKLIAGAGLDVFEQEPLSDASKLRKFENVLLTPHIGWKVDIVLHEFIEIAASHLKNWMRASLPKEVVLNPEVLQKNAHK